MAPHMMSVTMTGQWSANEAPRDGMRQAERLQRLHPGWVIWLGKASGCFDAVHPCVPEIVQARTAAEMAEKIMAWESVTSRVTNRAENA